MTWNIPGLFTENVHSKWQISQTPCTPKELGLLHGVMSKFGRTLRAAWRINEGTTSENFRVEHADGTFHLRTDSKNSEEAVVRIVRLTEYLSKSRGIVLREYEGKLWQLGDFVDGHHFRGRIGELANAAEAIADLHRKMREYPAADEFPKSSFGTMDISLWDKAASDMPESRTRALYREHCERLITLSITTENAVNKHRGPLSQLQLVHGDIHPQNLIMDGSNVAAIIDFGNVSFGTLGMDLGMACHRLVRQYMVCRNKERGERWENSLNTGLRVFLESYQDAMPDITNEHLRDMPHFMREILLRKIGYNLTLFAEGKRADDMACSQIERFIGLLNEVDEMGEYFAWK
ncbi:phosphotransferase [Candidatus Uhrbacteria bacterium]|nr:phosphotransferase [Candidatus Uhrbacteria bacterium]